MAAALTGRLPQRAPDGISAMSDSMRDAMQRAATALVGAEAMVDLRVPDAKPMNTPANTAEAAALHEVAAAIDQLRRAIETYQVTRGEWHGRPKIAIAWSRPPASGTERQEDSAQ